MNGDFRDPLRRDRDAVAVELDGLSAPARRGAALDALARLRMALKLHVLASEAVAWRAVEGAAGSFHADARVTEHRQLEALFARLAQAQPGTITWHARLAVLRERVRRHLDSQAALAARLAEGLPRGQLERLADDYERVRAKLAVLEEAKAA